MFDSKQQSVVEITDKLNEALAIYDHLNPENEVETNSREKKSTKVKKSQKKVQVRKKSHRKKSLKKWKKLKSKSKKSWSLRKKSLQKVEKVEVEAKKKFRPEKKVSEKIVPKSQKKVEVWRKIRPEYETERWWDRAGEESMYGW